MIDAAREVLRYTGHDAPIELHPEMPTGPLNRVADNSLAADAARLGAAGEVHGRPAPDGRLVLRFEGSRADRRRPVDQADRTLSSLTSSVTSHNHARRVLQPLLLSRQDRHRPAAHRSLRGSRPSARLSRVGRDRPAACAVGRASQVSFGSIRELHDGVEIHRVRGTRFDKTRFAGRATNYMTYFAVGVLGRPPARPARRRRRADRSADHRPGGLAGRQAVRARRS